MPLARNLTARSRSRSPVPPSDFKTSSSSRPFLPPSYYAAAAGLTYSPNSACNDGSDLGEVKKTLESKQYSTATHTNYHNAFMPISYPSESEAASNTSSEFQSTAGYYSFAGELNSLPSKSSLRAKHQSHIAGLPELEAQLLPSLRDTIDRMTRSPSRAGFSPSPGNGSHLGMQKLPNRAFLSRPPSPSGASCYPAIQHVDDSVTSLEINQLPLALENSFPDVQSRSITPVEISTPKPNTPTKSTLKSVLRPPTPKLFSGISLAGEYTSQAPSGGVSLKSVRSILKRKTSFTSSAASPTGSGTIRKSALKSPVKPTRLPPQLAKYYPDPRVGSTPEVASSSEEGMSETAKEAGRTFKSNIPRPYGKPRKDVRTVHTDDSDFEYRYEIEGRDRRKLIVANAEVVASSSESEVESKENVWNKHDVRSVGTGPVGLGLNLEPATRMNRVGIGSDWQTMNQSHKDSTSSTLRTRVSDISKYRTEPLQSGHHPHDTESIKKHSDLDVEHHRRRMALLGIVSGLELKVDPTYVEGESESEYCGEDGLAISGSSELSEQNKHAAFPVNDNFEDGDKTHEGRKTMRFQADEPRSSSRTPTFLLSANHNGYNSSLRAPRYSEHGTLPSTIGKGRKSPSRSPVIPQSDSPALPAALKRHSVYHRSSPSPNSSSGRMSSEITLNAPVSGNDDFPNVVPNPYATRECQTSSLSSSDFAATHQEIDQRRTGRALPHAESVDSNLSSVGSVYWNDECDSELSVGAETLFRKLSDRHAKEVGCKFYQDPDKVSCSNVSRTSSPSSIYEDQVIDGSWQNQYGSLQSQDNRQSPNVHTHIPTSDSTSNESCGDSEIGRQEVIVELCQSQRAFVSHLQIFVKHFILPLRVQDSKTWISGVPSEVARLFDWLEDIVILHRQILSTLESTCTAQYPTVECIADAIRGFIPRLEVYQPYLIKLMHITHLIDGLMQDENSDFGEFMTIQASAKECNGWDFKRFLVEPVNWLAKLPEFFARLLELTPKNHPDYLATLSLLHCTDMITRVLTEVKSQEDEYDLVKTISTRIYGLSPLVQLATRERRLLQQGILHLVDKDNDMGNPSIAATKVAKMPRYIPGPGNRTSKLAIAVNQLDTQRGRSGSTSSSSTGMSFSSIGTASFGVSSDEISTPGSTFSSSGRLAKSRIQASSKLLVSPSPAQCQRTPSQVTAVQVFVFTDLVLLATPTAEADGWTLLKHIGVVRILGLQDPELKRESNDPEVLVMDALPVDIEKLNHPIGLNDGPVTILRFAIPNLDAPADSDRSPSEREDTKRSWISAFQRCLQFTLCSMSIPSKNHDPKLDLALDAHQTIFSLLASGLPLPKSPSFQAANPHDGENDDAKMLEREERGWWSVRFQQVFRELQRRDMALMSSATVSWD